MPNRNPNEAPPNIDAAATMEATPKTLAVESIPETQKRGLLERSKHTSGGNFDDS
jgi:hypothetical protein